MNDNDVVNLSRLAQIRFSGRIRIDLYDHDTGLFDDSDDHLGTRYVWSSYAGRGEMTRDFTGSGANYTLTFEVVP